MKHRILVVTILFATLFALAPAAIADSVTFDNVAAPSLFSQATYNGLAYGNVTFYNGVVLSGYPGATTPPNVLATSDFLPVMNGTLPGTISAVFLPGASYVSFDIINGAGPGTFTAAAYDNVGALIGTESFFLASIGASANYYFPLKGIIQINLSSTQGAGQIDFATDTWNFTPVPEPASLLLLGTGLFGVWTQRHRLGKH